MFLQEWPLAMVLQACGAGCRDRETLDFRQGETDLPLAPTVYCYRQGDEETDVSIAWCCVGALIVNGKILFGRTRQRDGAEIEM
jgi:hypothetical protein